MAIDVEYQNERGQPLARYEGTPIDNRLLARASTQSCCLRFIDAFGDTTFNAAQISVLEEELALISSSGDNAGEQASSLLKFCKQLKDRTHVYLKFTGD